MANKRKNGVSRSTLRLPGRSVEPITLWGNPVLRTVATPVERFDDSVKALVDDLFETMYAISGGVGLAANQIGRLDRVFVFDCDDGVAGYVVNPRIEPIGTSFQTGGEGCLSLPSYELPTPRLMRCRVVGQDVDGNEIQYEGEGLRARCFQHEVDHLNGKLYIDHHHDEDRHAVEAAMRRRDWFGKDHLDPKSKAYRRAQLPDDD